VELLDRMDKFYYKDGTIKDAYDPSLILIKIEWDSGCVQFYNEQYLLHMDELDEHGNLKPALIHSDGSKEYWINGVRRQRSQGPAIEWANGIIEYDDGY